MSGTAPTLTRRQLNRATMSRQLLLERAEMPVPDTVARLCGMQAQEARPPFVGLFSRLAGFRTEDLHSLLQEHSVVRATFFRGTLHLLTAADYAAFRATIQPVLIDGMRVLGSRAAGLDVERVLPTATELYAQRPRNFTELRALLQAAFPEANERALGFAVRMHLPLLMVPTADRWGFPSVADFALAGDRLSARLAAEPAADELVRRYLAAFGPASPADAQTWSGMKGMKQVFARLRPELTVWRDEAGHELFDLPDAPHPAADTPAPPRFLPEFDNVVLAHADRTRVLADEHRGQVVTKNLRVRATVLHDGFACGTWDVERRRNTATLRITPFEPLAASAAKELTAEGESVLRFLEPEAATHNVTIA